MLKYLFAAPGLRELFKSIDTDGSGTITVEEMRRALRNWGHRINEASRAHMNAHCPFEVNGPAVSLRKAASCSVQPPCPAISRKPCTSLWCCCAGRAAEPDGDRGC